LVFFTAICYIFGHLVYFVVIWYTFFPFWYVVPKKSGNPGAGREKMHLAKHFSEIIQAQSREEKSGL
jgi:hypothetical protein